MFRLVKVLNNNTQYELQALPYTTSTYISSGCALSYSDGKLLHTVASNSPDFISITASDHDPKKIQVMQISKDMIFKVEFVGSITPVLGMSVGLSTYKYKMDAVTYNTNGKGTIVALDDDNKFVYVRFYK